MFPLSLLQRRLWFLERLAPGLPAYNMPFALEIRGQLDRDALAQSLRTLVERHEALRTRVRLVDDEPHQQIESGENIELRTVAIANAELDQFVERETEEPFDLEAGPLMRAVLIATGDDAYVLVLTFHHLVFDGWSLQVFLDELWDAYRARVTGEPANGAKRAPQYSAFTRWQHEALGGPLLAEQLAYWKRQLAGSPLLSSFPTDRPRPSHPSHRGAIVFRSLSPELSTTVKRFARGEGASSFMTFGAALAVLLHRYTGQDDVLVGCPIANRNRPEDERAVGFFVNTVVLRTDLSDRPSFRALVGRARDAALDAYEHQDVPFESVVEAVNPERSSAHSPLFQVLFQLDESAPTDRRVSSLEIRQRWLSSKTSKFDFSLAVVDTPSGFTLRAEYATDLYEASTIERLLDQLETLLESAVANPDERIDRLPLASEAERRILLAWGAPDAEVIVRDAVHVRFQDQAARTPDATAIAHDETTLSYAELDRRANRLAHYLAKSGATGKLVALLFEPSIDMVVAALGAMKAGAACVPLDPSYPRERLSNQMAETEAPVLLSVDRLAGRVPRQEAQLLRLDRDWELVAHEPDHPPRVEVGAGDLAYVVYTSGSTGRPSGVLLTHRTLVNLVDWHFATIGRPSRMLQFAPLSFDVGFYEMFAALSGGGTLVLADTAVRTDVELLANVISSQRIDQMVLPVIALSMLAERFCQQPAGLQTLKAICATGDRLRISDSMVRLFEKLPGARLFNLYGPSEAHVVTAHPLGEKPSDFPRLPPIGKPISGVRVWVSDASGEPSAIGVVGEIRIGGDSLARGYLDRPKLDAERFETGPAGRVYRTGDRARWRSDGTLEFLGRNDDQVKLRGLRIELGEIEAVLCRHDGVRAAAALVREDTPGDQRLVAYYVPAEPAPSEAELHSHSLRWLPQSMIPSAFVALPELPMTSRGKLDRALLPEPSGRVAQENYVAPRDEIEIRIAEIWARLLGVDRVGSRNNFFELGGHSLLATQAVARISRSFGVQMPVRRLFEAPTVEATAEEVRRLAGVAPVVPKLSRRADRESFPISFNQERNLYAQRNAPDVPNVVPRPYTLEGPLDRAALERAAREVFRRHEVLRARYDVSCEPFSQTIGPVEVSLPILELEAGPEDVEQRARRAISRILFEPLDLARGTACRIHLFGLAPDRHLLVVFAHHAVWDGASAELFITELMTLYEAFRRGDPSPLPEPSFQYADFAAWQREFYQSADGQAQIAWWTERLADARGPVFVTDGDREAVEARRRESPNAPFRRGVELRRTAPGVYARLAALARRLHATPYETLLTVFVAWLGRASNQSDLTFCSQHLNRHVEGTEDLIGCFAQALVIRAEADPKASFVELLERVRRYLLSARARADVVGPFMNLSRFRVNFNYFPRLDEDRRDGSLRVTSWDPESVGQTIWYDLTLHASLAENELELVFWYNTALWEAGTIRRFLDEFTGLLDRILDEPDQELDRLEDRRASS